LQGRDCRVGFGVFLGQMREKEPEVGLKRERSEPMKGEPLYLQVERRIEDLLLGGRYRAGDRIPPEAELVDTLDVSRVTVRAGLARLVERGVLERRQGSGTFLVRPPGGSRLAAGLERLETYTVHAERLGLKLDSRDLSIKAAGATPEESAALEVPRGTSLVKVSRVLLVEGKPAAWMVDVVPEDVIGVEELRDRFRPDAMVLDVLVSEGVSVGFSQMFIEAVVIDPDERVGRILGLGALSAALSLTQTMYLVDGRPVQWSRDTFLPGHLNLHIVRELFEVRKLS
jgi:GntR family transcriptional regulator